ncbi:MAG TPA: DUF599 family protein [Terricaulis sp.]|nr:DUF599 family protein [Terricaulis sp.]
MHISDMIGLTVFLICWVGYEPLRLRLMGLFGKTCINQDMYPVREAWLREFLLRENRIMDVNLLGHLLSSASFFASTNLLLIAATAGVLFGGEAMQQSLQQLEIAASASGWLMEAKIAIVTVTLSRGLLDFIWSIRQLNYSLAVLGAAPDTKAVEKHAAFVKGAADVLHPAFSAFNRGVRAYYFALAAAAWIISPWAMAIGVVFAVFVLLRRQLRSQAARGIHAVSRLTAD